MSSTSETGQITGTRDKDYNLIWFTEQCMSNALRMDSSAAGGVKLHQSAKASARK